MTQLGAPWSSSFGFLRVFPCRLVHSQPFITLQNNANQWFSIQLRCPILTAERTSHVQLVYCNCDFLTSCYAHRVFLRRKSVCINLILPQLWLRWRKNWQNSWKAKNSEPTWPGILIFIISQFLQCHGSKCLTSLESSWPRTYNACMNWINWHYVQHWSHSFY